MSKMCTPRQTSCLILLGELLLNEPKRPEGKHTLGLPNKVQIAKTPQYAAATKRVLLIKRLEASNWTEMTGNEASGRGPFHSCTGYPD
jgi:hypothetical protein